MKTYRDIQFEVWNTHFIKLYNKAGVRKEATNVYRNGEGYVTIPKEMAKCPELFARNVIDRLYTNMQYHKDYELRERLK